ncbi:MAG: penicillin-binding protein activator LpoB [Planctomycetes bacterium]|nr:penicillin-binding protein activator LpoB [Planctomycetota bacterium]
MRKLIQRVMIAAALTASLMTVDACKNGNQFARVIQPGDKEMIGSHAAGQETYRPLVEEAVCKLLDRHPANGEPSTSAQGELLPAPRQQVCFVGVTNKSSEELGDIKDSIYHAIDSKLHESGSFAPISRQYVDAGLRDLRLRPDDLFMPAHMRNFVGVMERNGQPIEYLLFATVTSLTTRENKDYQRDYQLVLELVDIRDGKADKQVAMISKAYHQSRASRWSATHWPFSAK